MITIRSYNPSDINKARFLHTRYFIDEFDFPDFLNMHGAVTVEDGHGAILIGGIRPIAEVVVVTNKDASVRVRKEALLKFLQFCLHVGTQFHYDQLHAFCQDPEFIEHLKKYNFRNTKGQSLVSDI